MDADRNRPRTHAWRPRRNVTPTPKGTESDDLNDEYVVIENGGSSGVDASGWTLSDGASHTYRFPSGVTLDASAAVTLRTGSAPDTSTAFYWGSGAAIRNNSGETATLEDDAENVVDTCSC